MVWSLKPVLLVNSCTTQTEQDTGCRLSPLQPQAGTPGAPQMQQMRGLNPFYRHKAQSSSRRRRQLQRLRRQPAECDLHIFPAPNTYAPPFSWSPHHAKPTTNVAYATWLPSRCNCEMCKPSSHLNPNPVQPHRLRRPVGTPHAPAASWPWHGAPPLPARHPLPPPPPAGRRTAPPAAAGAALTFAACSSPPQQVSTRWAAEGERRGAPKSSVLWPMRCQPAAARAQEAAAAAPA